MINIIQKPNKKLNRFAGFCAFPWSSKICRLSTKSVIPIQFSASTILQRSSPQWPHFQWLHWRPQHPSPGKSSGPWSGSDRPVRWRSCCADRPSRLPPRWWWGYRKLRQNRCRWRGKYLGTKIESWPTGQLTTKLSVFWNANLGELNIRKTWKKAPCLVRVSTLWVNFSWIPELCQHWPIFCPKDWTSQFWYENQNWEAVFGSGTSTFSQKNSKFHSCIWTAMCLKPPPVIRGWPWRVRRRCWEAVMICKAKLAKCSKAQDLIFVVRRFFTTSMAVFIKWN